MKTIFLLSALAAAVLAAPAPAPLKPGLGPIGENLPEATKREKKSPTFGKGGGVGHGVGYVPVAVVPVQHALVPGQLGHHHQSLHKPHYFRDSDDNGQQLETEAALFKRDSEIKEEKSDMEKNLVFAKAAVEDLERDMLKIESNPSARNQWKNADLESDIALHENLEKAREALDNARKSFSELESARNAPIQNEGTQQPAAIGQVQPFQKPVSHEMKPAAKQRLAQWKENVESIPTNGKSVLADERSLKPEEEKVIQTKNAQEMDVSASENKKLFAKVDSQWHHNMETTNMKSADLESAVRASPNQPEMPKPAGMMPQHMPMSHEGQPTHEQRMALSHHNIDALRTNVHNSPLGRSSMKITEDKEDILKRKNAETEIQSKWHQVQNTNMKSADFISGVEHERANSNLGAIDSTLKGQHVKPIGSNAELDAAKSKKFIQTTETMRADTDFDDLEFKKQHSAAAHMRNQQQFMAPTMKAAESIPQGMRHMHTLRVPQRHDSEYPHGVQMNQNLNRFNKQEKNSGFHAFAKSSDDVAHHDMDNQEQSRGKSTGIDFMREATPEQHWRSMQQQASARGAYGGGYGSSVGVANAGAAGAAGPAIGVFPGARVGGCALPLLLSCSPSVVSGSLAHAAHPAAPVEVAAAQVPVAASYGVPAVGAAVYGPAPAAYRSADHLNINKKRDTNKLNKVKPIKRTNGPILQKTRIIESVQ